MPAVRVRLRRPPDLHQIGLMQQVKAVERLTIEAAITRSPDAALKAFALHPLVDSVSVARELLRGYVDAIPEVAEVLNRRRHTPESASHHGQRRMSRKEEALDE